MNDAPLQPRQPAPHAAAVGFAGCSKGGAEVRLFVENYEEVGAQKPGQREERNGGRVLAKAVAEEGEAAAEAQGYDPKST